jgi:hypothetical protein
MHFQSFRHLNEIIILKKKRENTFALRSLHFFRNKIIAIRSLGALFIWVTRFTIGPNRKLLFTRGSSVFIFFTGRNRGAPGNGRLRMACDIAGDEWRQWSMSWPAWPYGRAWLGWWQPIAVRPQPQTLVTEVAAAAALYGGAAGRSKVRGGAVHAGDGDETLAWDGGRVQWQGADGSKLLAQCPWRTCSRLCVHVLLARRGLSASAGRSGKWEASARASPHWHRGFGRASSEVGA